VENSPEACARALAEGFGLERICGGMRRAAFYISHDASQRSAENRLEAFTELFGRHPAAELAI